MKNGDLKKNILGHLKDGKKKFVLLEKNITGDPKVRSLLEKARSSKMKLEKARDLFNRYEQMAEKYVKKNPKKAVAMAVAAGIVAGSIWSALKGNKPSSPKKALVPRTKRTPLKP